MEGTARRRLARSARHATPSTPLKHVTTPNTSAVTHDAGRGVQLKAEVQIDMCPPGERASSKRHSIEAQDNEHEARRLREQAKVREPQVQLRMCNCYGWHGRGAAGPADGRGLLDERDRVARRLGSGGRV